MDTEIQELIQTLRRMKSGSAFSTFIDYIVFPRYKRLAPNQRITFGFPLTVLVGQNGTGKSSILHALAGAPDDTSVGQFWFGTKVDPIAEPRTATGNRTTLTETERATFWYSYRHEGQERQAIKARVRRTNDPDNWEPRRFGPSFGMTVPPPSGPEGRHPQIVMKVRYLNLRLFLSAFDKCFHFISTQTLKQFKRKGWKGGVRKEPQARDFIRHRAGSLEKAFDSTTGVACGKNPMAEPVVQLSDDTLTLVSEIVGKKYTAGWLLRHRYYESWGDSVRFVTDALKYTEANAGSGETAVVKIVRLFETAEEHSLLLLDEPETSLHPGAQAQLLKFILQQIKKKKLQVVISTHAPAFVRHLPEEAIKVLRPMPDGHVGVLEPVTWQDAFHEIGQEFDPNCNIVVEDQLAKSLLDAVALTQGPAFAARVRIRFGHGGDSAMKQDAAVFIKDPVKAPIMIFDGDKTEPHQDPGKLTQEQMTSAELDRIIARQVGAKITFAQDSKTPEDRKVRLRIDYLNYFWSKVFYLPFPSPDEAIWSDEAARSHLTATVLPGKVDAIMRRITAAKDYKERFARLAKELGDDLRLPSLHSMFVKRFVERNDPLREQLVALLNRALVAAEAAHA